MTARSDRPGGAGVILVDTSVWIEVFRRPSRLTLASVADIEEVVTCLPVVQEVLQGFRDERAFGVARDAMLAFPIVESPLRRESSTKRFGSTGRRAGPATPSGPRSTA